MKRVTQKDFDMVKLLQTNGIARDKISTVTDYSRTTIQRRTDSATFADYLELQKRLKPKISMLEETVSPTNQVLINLTDAIIKMTYQWKTMETKLNEVLETKRPWFKKGEL